MAENIVCEFCNSSFSSKSNLVAHKKRAKKCLKIQKKEVPEDFSCEKCEKIFTSKHGLNEHRIKCNTELWEKYVNLENKYEIAKKVIDEKNIQIKSLQEQIKQLQSKIVDIAIIGAKKDTTKNTYRVNNNIIQNLVPYDLNKEKIHTIVDEKFTENYLYGRENGIANFAVSNLLKDEEQKLKMLCTDTARKIFVYKDSEGNLYKDVCADKFLENYLPAVKEKSHKIILNKEGDEMVELTECVMNIEHITVSNKLAGKLSSSEP